MLDHAALRLILTLNAAKVKTDWSPPFHYFDKNFKKRNTEKPFSKQQQQQQQQQHQKSTKNLQRSTQIL